MVGNRSDGGNVFARGPMINARDVCKSHRTFCIISANRARLLEVICIEI